MTKIEELRKARFQFLNLLYEKTGGDKFSHQNMHELGKELGFEQKLTDTVTQYLEGERLLEYTEMGGGIGITHYGVKEVEAALSNPEKPTHYFPPVNIININNMVGSNIQQGTSHSNQSGNIKLQNIPDINKFINKLKDDLSSISLPPDDKDEIETDIATIESQTESKRPKPNIIKESLNSIKRILEGASGSILAQQLLHNLPAIINSL